MPYFVFVLSIEVSHVERYIKKSRQISDLKISVITTMKAYEELCLEGLVTSVQGKGFVVNPQDTAMIREQRLREVEDHLLEALEAAKTIGMTVEEVKDLITVLDNAE